MQNPFVPDLDLLQALKRRSISVACLNGRILFKQGEAPIALHILNTGAASLLIKTDNGKEVADLSLGARSILGLPPIVANELHCLSALACTGSEVSFVVRAGILKR